MSDKKILIELNNVKKWFPIKSGLLSPVKIFVHAVDGVNLVVNKGETLGVVGESGCGKTTLGRLILNLIPITSGSIIYEGVELKRMRNRDIRKKMQIVFQDPGGSMNPRMTVRSIVSEPLIVNGHSDGAGMTKKVGDLLESVGLKRNHMTRFPHEFSGGQKQRVALARALALEPDFILLDEPTSALDVSVQAQVLNLLDEIQKQRGLTFVFITHSLNVVHHISDRVAVMYLGKIAELAKTDDLFERPAHPYTHALLSAIPEPTVGQDRSERIVLSGDVPSPADPPSGCRFHTRCPIAKSGICDIDEPELIEIDTGHKVACHFPLVPGQKLPMIDEQ